MKNVAKCDTWCELQNPANHRVFERKLRPKPLGRGHVCLGVTHRRPHPPARVAGGADDGLPCAPRSRLAQKRALGDESAAAIGGNARESRPPRAPVVRPGLPADPARRPRRRSRRDPRSGGITR